MENFHYSEKEKTNVTKEEIRRDKKKHLVSEKQNVRKATILNDDICILFCKYKLYLFYVYFMHT
jgi:hypothetical protein